MIFYKRKKMFLLFLAGILCLYASGCGLQSGASVNVSSSPTNDTVENPAEFVAPELEVTSPQAYDFSVVSGVRIQVRNDLQLEMTTERDVQSFGYIIKIHDDAGNEVQRIVVENQTSIYAPYFTDLNFDGFPDLVVPMAGTINMTSQPYLWDNEKGEFVDTILEGFEFLSYFEVREDHIACWIKETGYSGTFLTLVWDGNILRMESSEDYDNIAERERVLGETS